MESPSEKFFHSIFNSPVGELKLVASDRGLRAVLFHGGKEAKYPLAESSVSKPGHPILKQAAEQLREYFAGKRKRFELPLHIVGTEFQIECWKALKKIPFGSTISYAEQAKLLGAPHKARAVGGANGRNPLPIVVPCHRVVGKNGTLTGFGGGLPIKRALLTLEAGGTPE